MTISPEELADQIAAQGSAPATDQPRVRIRTVPPDLAPLVQAAAARHGVPGDLFAALLHHESSFNPQARSPVGAQGVGQLMPATSRQLGVKNPWDPAENIDGSARYLRQQLDEFGDERLALAAYNAGPGNVRKHKGIPPFAETQGYVRNIMASRAGFAVPNPTPDARAEVVSQIRSGRRKMAAGVDPEALADQIAAQGAPPVATGPATAQSPEEFADDFAAGAVTGIPARPVKPAPVAGPQPSGAPIPNPQMQTRVLQPTADETALHQLRVQLQQVQGQADKLNAILKQQPVGSPAAKVAYGTLHGAPETEAPAPGSVNAKFLALKQQEASLLAKSAQSFGDRFRQYQQAAEQAQADAAALQAAGKRPMSPEQAASFREAQARHNTNVQALQQRAEQLNQESAEYQALAKQYAGRTVHSGLYYPQEPQAATTPQGEALARKVVEFTGNPNLAHAMEREELGRANAMLRGDYPALPPLAKDPATAKRQIAEKNALLAKLRPDNTGINFNPLGGAPVGALGNLAPQPPQALSRAELAQLTPWQRQLYPVLQKQLQAEYQVRKQAGAGQALLADTGAALASTLAGEAAGELVTNGILRSTRYLRWISAPAGAGLSRGGEAVFPQITVNRLRDFMVRGVPTVASGAAAGGVGGFAGSTTAALLSGESLPKAVASGARSVVPGAVFGGATAAAAHTLGEGWLQLQNRYTPQVEPVIEGLAANAQHQYGLAPEDVPAVQARLRQIAKAPYAQKDALRAQLVQDLDAFRRSGGQQNPFAPEPEGATAAPNAQQATGAQPQAPAGAGAEPAAQGPPTDATAPPVARQTVPEATVSAPPATPASTELPVPSARPSRNYYELPTHEIVADPERFQYKQTGKSGVTSRYQGVDYNPEQVGVLSVWRDPADGRAYVINGHHRLEMAQRALTQGNPQADRLPVKFINAQDASEARVIGALENIADDKGSPIDAATIFRETGITPDDVRRTYNIALRGPVARQGVALANLAPNLWNMVRKYEMPVSRGVAIAEALPNHADQQGLMALLARLPKGREVTDSLIGALVQEVRQAGRSTAQTGGLFDDLGDVEVSHALDRAQLRDWVTTQLSKSKRLFGYVAKDSRARDLEAGNNQIDVERSAAIAQRSAQVLEVFDRLANASGPVSAALTRAAEAIRNGEDRTTVRNRLLGDIENAVSATLAGSQGAGAGGSGAAPTRGLVGAEPAGSGTGKLQRAAPADGEQRALAPRHTSAPQFDKPLWEMSPDELDAAHDRMRQYEKAAAVEVFGPEGGKRYETLQRQTGSFDSQKADAASREIAEMEAGLTPEQERRLFGIGETGPNADDLREFARKVHSVGSSDLDDLAHSLQWAITRIGNVEPDQIAQATQEQQIAFAQLRRGYEIAQARGWDTGELTRQVLQYAGNRFGNQQDAEYMLRRFIEPQQPASKPAPRRKALPASAAPPSAAPSALPLEGEPPTLAASIRNHIRALGTGATPQAIAERLTAEVHKLDDVARAVREMQRDGEVFRAPDGHYVVGQQPAAGKAESLEGAFTPTQQKQLPGTERSQKPQTSDARALPSRSAKSAPKREQAPPSTTPPSAAPKADADTPRPELLDRPAPAIVQDVLRLVAPVYAGGPAAKETAAIIRENLGALALQRERAAETLREARRVLDRQSPADNYRFIDDIEHGRKVRDARLQPIADALRQMLDERRDLVQALGTGKLEDFIEHYFPHAWKDPKKAGEVFGQMTGRRPLEGPKSFLKKRSLPTFQDGIDAGLKPISDNPVDLVLAKTFEIDRFLMGQQILADLKSEGLAQYVSVSQKPPQGWQRINDAIGTVYGPPVVEVHEAYDKLLFDQLMAFADSLGVDVDRTVRLGGQRWGVAIGDEKIRLRFAGPETILTHELGHIIDERYGLHEWLTDRGQYRRKIVGQELKALADLRFEGMPEEDVPAPFRRYVRQESEQVANLVHAIVHAPEKAAAVAPNAVKRFRAFVNLHPELKPLLEVKPSLVMGSNTAEVPVGGVVIAGNYYCPAPAARVLNNHLSPGLQGVALYQLYRGWGNLLNGIQLGLSAFHFTFVSVDAAVSKVALGMNRLGYGEAGGVVDLLKGITPLAAPIETAIKGDRLLKAYLTPEKMGPELAPLVQALVQAGGRVSMDVFYRSAGPGEFRQAVRRAIHGLRERKAGEAAAGGLEVARTLLPTVIDTVAYPLMSYYVPRIKLGVFMDIAGMELRRLGPDADPRVLRDVLQQAWDSVDNRLGQMTYDHLFWHRALKDLGMATIRSLGWNIGTLREVGGGMWDLGAAAFNRSPDGRRKGATAGNGDAEGPEGAPITGRRLTYRAAYVLALVASTALTGMVVQYLYTGKGPRELLDVFFPRTGKRLPNGKEERLAIPGYLKDIYAYWRQPGETVTHKLHPLIGLLSDMLQNRDFYGVQIRNPEDPLVKQAQDVGRYMLDQYTPIALQGTPAAPQAVAERLHVLPASAPVSGKKQTPAEQVRSFFGVNDAPSYVDRTAAEEKLHEYLSRRSPSGPLTRDEFEEQNLRRELLRELRDHDPGAYRDLRQAQHEGRLTSRQVQQALRNFRKVPLQVGFNMLALDEALRVYEAATPDERRKLHHLLMEKANKTLLREPPAQRRELRAELLRAKQLPVAGRTQAPAGAPR